MNADVKAASEFEILLTCIEYSDISVLLQNSSRKFDSIEVLSLNDDDGVVWSSLQLTCDLLRSDYKFAATLLIVFAAFQIVLVREGVRQSLRQSLLKSILYVTFVIAQISNTVGWL